MKQIIIKLVLISILFSLLITMGSAAKLLVAEEESVTSSGPDEGAIFLKIILPKTKFYFGEQIPLSIAFYVNNLQVDEVDYPRLDQGGFVFEYAIEGKQSSTEINGYTYQVVKYSIIATPLQTGDLFLGPAVINCKVFQNNARRNLEISSKKVKLRVIPLPVRGKSIHFSGGVGNFSIQVNLGSATVRQGDPFTVKIAVSGFGNLQNIRAPYLANTNGLKAFPAQVAENSTRKVVFEQVIIPLNTDLTKIGPFTFDFYDPDQGSYRTVTANLPIAIKINPQFTGNQKIQPSKENEKPTRSLAGLKESSADLCLNPQPLVTQLKFWLLQLIPLIIFLVVVYYRNYQQLLQTDSPRSRAIKTTNQSVRQLAEAKSLLEREKYDELLDELHLILREYLGGRFEIAAAGMTGAVVDALKQFDPGFNQTVLEQIKTFFTQYDLYRFTGTTFQPDDAVRLWQTVKAIISSINQMPSVKIEPVGQAMMSQGGKGKNNA